MAFTNYITPTEFYKFHPVKTLVNEIKLTPFLESAGVVVGSHLRGRGDNLASYQLPIMMTADTSKYARTTFTADTTGPATDGLNSLRMVVDSGSSPSDTVTVALEGSYDETVWVEVRGLDGQPLKLTVTSDNIVSGSFNTKYPHYQYKVVTTESVDLGIYLVDTSVDELIRWKALEMAMLAISDGEGREQNILDEAKVAYIDALSVLRPDYDADGDETIEEAEQQTQNISIGYR